MDRYRGLSKAMSLLCCSEKGMLSKVKEGPCDYIYTTIQQLLLDFTQRIKKKIESTSCWL